MKVADGMRAWSALAMWLAVAMAGAALPSIAAPGAPVEPAGHGVSRPDFSGDWVLDAAASDDPREKSREAWRDGQQAGGGRAEGPSRTGTPGRGKGRGGQGDAGRPAGARAEGGTPAAALAALPEPARAMRIRHEDPSLSITDEHERRRHLHTDFRGASVSASGGLHQRIATAGWEGGDLVIETTALDLKEVQRWRVDGGTGQLVIAVVAEASGGQTVSYRLVYDRRKSGPVAPQ